MRIKSRRLKLPQTSFVLASSLLLLLALPRLGSWVGERFGAEAEATDPQFELAYESVLELSKIPGYGRSNSFSSYGINQLDYDRWRQLNGKAVEELAEIEPEEIKAIYWSRWQTGECERYQAPLDIVCLDSVISFGAQQSQRLLANLPTDPQAAALEVVSRRELLRRRQVRPPMTPSKQLSLREGLTRDRALADLVAQPQATPTPLPSSPQQPQNNAPSANRSTDLTAEQVYSQVKPSTVEIWDTTQRGIASTASGIVLTSNGLILTNYHVVGSNSAPSVKLADGRKFSGTVTSIDPDLDLALIQLKGASQLPTTPFASDTTQTQVGDRVYAIGFPFGESWKLSTSQVIQLNSTCANGTSPLRCIRTPSGFLHPGNSGGPLINESGQVIGLNRAVQQSTGEGVSIPVETIQSFLNSRVGHPQPSKQPEPESNSRSPRQWRWPWL